MTILLTMLLIVGTPSDEHIDFDTEVVPVLTKSGCNAASCHGAAAGRGGFQLSLFGGDPAFDHQSIVRELRGRRVNLADPEFSLLLRKPTGEMDHEGGLRFESHSMEADILTRWLEQGGQRRQAPTLVALEVDPRSIDVATIPATNSISVFAEFSDGTRKDVSRWAVFESDDPASVSVDDDGSVAIQRRGRSHIIVSYLSQLTVIPVSVPYAQLEAGDSRATSSTWIDAPIDESLRQLGLEPSKPASHETLLRRLSVDLTGQLPDAELVDRFLSSDDPDKYAAFVESLLADDQFNEYWAHQLSILLRLKSPVQEPQVAESMRNWLVDQMAADRSWSEMVQDIIVANGDTHTNGPAVVHRLSADARAEAEYVSEVFLGVRLRCANCHNHPLDRWTQDDYHGLAAIFARVGRGRTIRELTSGEVQHPATGEAAIPKVPGDRWIDPANDARTELGEWIRNDPERYIAKAMVNRLWKHMLGRGLVEPVDDLRASNPAAHPELLEALTDFFVANDYKIRPLLRAIALSDVYRRGGPTGQNEIDDRFGSHFKPTALDPSVLLDAIVRVTGVPETFASEPTVDQAILLNDPSSASPALDVLGRCPVDADCGETVGGGAPTLPQVLHLINGELLNRRLEAPDSTLSLMLEEGVAPIDIIQTFYLTALARRPSETELEFWKTELGTIDDNEVRELLEDFLWSLLNSAEFRTKH